MLSAKASLGLTHEAPRRAASYVKSSVPCPPQHDREAGGLAATDNVELDTNLP